MLAALSGLDLFISAPPPHLLPHPPQTPRDLTAPSPPPPGLQWKQLASAWCGRGKQRLLGKPPIKGAMVRGQETRRPGPDLDLIQVPILEQGHSSKLPHKVPPPPSGTPSCPPASHQSKTVDRQQRSGGKTGNSGKAVNNKAPAESINSIQTGRSGHASVQDLKSRQM